MAERTSDPRIIRFRGPDQAEWTGHLHEQISQSGSEFRFWLEANDPELTASQFAATKQFIEAQPWIYLASEKGEVLHLGAARILNSVTFQGRDIYGPKPLRLSGFAEDLISHRQPFAPHKHRYAEAWFAQPNAAWTLPFNSDPRAEKSQNDHRPGETVFECELSGFGSVKFITGRTAGTGPAEYCRVHLLPDRPSPLNELAGAQQDIHAFLDFLYGKRSRLRELCLSFAPPAKQPHKSAFLPARLMSGGVQHEEDGKEAFYRAAIVADGEVFQAEHLSAAVASFWEKRELLRPLINVALMAPHCKSNMTWGLFAALAMLDAHTQTPKQDAYRSRLETIACKRMEEGWPLPEPGAASTELKKIRTTLMHEGRLVGDSFGATLYASALLYGEVCHHLGIPYRALRFGSTNISGFAQVADFAGAAR